MAYRPRISKDTAKSLLISPEEHAGMTFDFVQRAHDGEEIGYGFGLADLDQYVLGGVKPGDLVIIGARPGSGKSFFVNHVLTHNAKKGHACLFVSAEMTATQLGVRGFSYTARIDSKNIFAGNIGDDDWPKIVDAATVRSQLPIWLVAHKGVAEKERIRRPPFTIDLVDMTLELLYENGINIELVGIDYLQRLRSDQGHKQRKDIADEISAGAKDIALKYAVPVLMASQLNRGVEERVPPIPVESDYKESGNIEEDADVTMSMFYPRKYYEDGMQIPGSNRACSKNQVYIRLHKQRGGESYVGAWVWFDPRFAHMASLEETLAIDM